MGGCGGSGGDDQIDLFKGCGEVVADEGPGFLRLEVVGIVVAGAENVGAEEDAAFDLWTEAFGTRLDVMLHEIGGGGGAVAVADSIEASEVGRGLGGGEDVVGGDACLGVGQADLFDVRAEGFELDDATADCGFDIGMEAIDEVFLG